MGKITKQNIQKSNKIKSVKKSNKIKSVKKSNKRKSVKKSNKRKSIKKLGGNLSIEEKYKFFAENIYIYLRKLYGPHYAVYLEDVQLENETEKTYRNFLLLGESHIDYSDIDNFCDNELKKGNNCMDILLAVLSTTPICTDFFLEGATLGIDDKQQIKRQIKPNKPMVFKGGFLKKCEKGNNDCNGMLNLVRSYKNDENSYMRFHTIDLRLLGEKKIPINYSMKNSNNNSIISNIGIKIYRELIREIINNVVNSLSDLLLKHMNLMNTIYTDYINNDSKIINIHQNIDYILQSLLNVDLFNNYYSMEYNQNTYHIINYAVKTKSNFDIVYLLKKLILDYNYRLINPINPINIFNNINLDIKNFINNKKDDDLDNLYEYINELKKYEKMNDNDITEYINFEQKIIDFDLKNKNNFNIIELSKYENNRPENDEHIFNHPIFDKFQELFNNYEDLYVNIIETNNIKIKTEKKSQQDIINIHTKFNMVLKSLYIFKCHTKRVLYKEMYNYLEEYNNIKNIINRQFEKTLLKREDFIKHFDNIWGKVILNNLSDLNTQTTLMDIYTLCRMFAKFDEEKEGKEGEKINKLERGPVTCRNGLYNNPRNIIFYGGCKHTNNYAKFINAINKNKSNPNNFTINSCDTLFKEPYVDFTTIEKHKDGFNFFRNTKEFEELIDYHNTKTNNPNSSNNTKPNNTKQETKQ